MVSSLQSLVHGEHVLLCIGCAVSCPYRTFSVGERSFPSLNRATEKRSKQSHCAHSNFAWQLELFYQELDNVRPRERTELIFFEVLFVLVHVGNRLISMKISFCNAYRCPLGASTGKALKIVPNQSSTLPN